MPNTSTASNNRNAPERPGEPLLRRAIHAYRRRTDQPQQAAASLISVPGPDHVALDDLGAAGLLDAGGRTASRTHRLALVHLRGMTGTLTLLDDGGIADAVYDAWLHAAEQMLLRAVVALMTEPGPLDERERTRQVEDALAGIAHHAVARTPDVWSGVAPESPRARSGGNRAIVDRTYLHATRPSPQERWLPTVRARWLIDAVIRVPQLHVVRDAVVDALAKLAPASTVVRDELTSAVEAYLQHLVLSDVRPSGEPGQGQGASNLDLRRVAEGGVLGWARRTGAKIARSKHRDIVNLRTAFPSSPISIPREQEQWTSLDAAVVRGELEATGDQWERDQSRIDDEVDGLGVDGAALLSVEPLLSATASKPLRILLASRAMLSAFQVPTLVPPTDTAGARYLLASLREDPALANRSLKAHHDGTLGARTADQDDIAPDAVALWQSLSTHEAARLLSRSPEIARTVALGAVLPLPKIEHAAHRAFLTLVVGSSLHPDWPALAERVAAAFVAVSAGGRPSAAADREWSAQLSALAGAAYRPLGSHPAATLRRFAIEALTLQATNELSAQQQQQHNIV